MGLFNKNLGAVSNELGERFHQDVKTIVTRYKGCWGPTIMGDYCWFLKKGDLKLHMRKK